MAGEMLEYSGLTTKVRAMKGRLLSREDYERIAEFQTVQETIAFLREQESYGKIYGGRQEVQHRGQVEELIYHSIQEDYRKLYQFADKKQRRAMELYVGQLRFEKGARIDAAYFAKVWKDIEGFSGKKMQKILKEVFGTQIDWLNIMWIFRARQFFHQKAEGIEEMLIPVFYKLKRREIQMLLETDQPEEFQRILGNTAYYKGRQALVRIQDEISYHYVMEKMYRRLCQKCPFSMAPVYYYFYKKQKEIENLTTALEGIRYQLPPKEIRELLLIS